MSESSFRSLIAILFLACLVASSANAQVRSRFPAANPPNASVALQKTPRAGDRFTKPADLKSGVFRLRYRDPESMKKLILGLPAKELDLKERESFRIVADTPSSSIIARGDESQLKAVKSVVDAFDVDDLGKLKEFGSLRFYELKERAPEDIAAIIQKLEIPVEVLLPGAPADFGPLDDGGIDFGSPKTKPTERDTRTASQGSKYETLIRILTKETGSQNILVVRAKQGQDTESLDEVTKLLNDLDVLADVPRPQPENNLDSLFDTGEPRDDIFR